jgi:hypothetical protein
MVGTGAGLVVAWLPDRLIWNQKTSAQGNMNDMISPSP